MQRTKNFKTAWLFAALLTLTFVKAQAQSTITNADGAALNATASWVGGVLPGSANVAAWDHTVQLNSSFTLGADTSWAGIQILDPAVPITINAGNKLTLGASGIDMSMATNALTLANTVSNSVSQTWNVTNGLTLTASGVVSGPNTAILTKTGNGTLIMGVANTYSGGTVVSGGTLQLNVVAGAGSGGGVTNQNGTTLRLNVAGTVVNQVNFNGTCTVDLNNLGTSALNGAWSGSGTVNIINKSPGSTFTVGGNGNGGGTFANFSGTFEFGTNSGALRFNDGGGTGGGPNFGSTTATFDLGTGAGALTMRNRGTTVNLGALIGGPNTVLTAASTGSGTVNYSIGGNNANTTFAGSIVNTPTVIVITKVGSGTLTYTGTNTSTGGVTINGGVLQIGDGVTSGAGTLGSGPVVINGGKLLLNKPDAFALTNAISGAGALIQTNTSTLTYYGTNTASGTTIISQGTFVVGASGLLSCPIFVASGATFDVSQTTFNLSSTLSGFGTVTGLVTSANGTISPGGSGAAGTLSFSNGVTELGGVSHTMELSSVGGTNDLINIVGNLTVSGANPINLTHFGGGAIPIGIYPLIAYTGTLSLSDNITNNFPVTAVGVSGTVTNITSTTPPEIAVIISPAARGATNLTWVGDGAANNWDNTTSNWVNGATSFAFQTGDSVRFDTTGAANPTVNVNITVSPASVVASNTGTYTFTGLGNIAGTGTSLIKTNSGTLTILTTNSYTGPTIIGGGTLAVSYLTNGTVSSGIGAASSNPTNLVFFGATLSYTGPNAYTDRGATLNGSGGTFDIIPGSTLELDGTITGPGALIQTDTGTLTINNSVLPNTYSGGTVLNNSLLALGGNIANTSGLGTGNVTFAGGTLQLFGYTGSNGNHYNALTNPLVVLAGQTGTLQMFSRGPTDNTGITSPLTGGGTLNLVVNFQRGSIDGNWSAFTGLINVTAKSGADHFRTKSTYGYVNAAIFLNDGVNFYNNGNAGATIDIGELGGTSGAFLGLGNTSQNNAAANPTWRIGAKNTTNTFAGTIINDGTTSITKIGTGTLILSGQNTYTGSTTISNGVLALTNNAFTFVDGSISSSTNIFINSGAFLDASGISASTLPLYTGQVISGNGTIAGILDTTAGGTVSPGGGITGATGTLTVTNAVTLGGTAWMKLNRNSSPTSDKLVSSLSSITYGGTLIITNIGASLKPNDTFTLFSGAALNGGLFGTIQLPNYYTWDTSNLGVNGTIKVVTALPPPNISSVDFSTIASGTITLNATNGILNGNVTVLTSTNVALPLSNWTTVTTTTFDGSGNLNLPITVNPAAPQQFFILQAY